jgi:hypothetical protein
MRPAHLGLLVVALMNPPATVVQDRPVVPFKASGSRVAVASAATAVQDRPEVIFAFADSSCGAWARSQGNEAGRAQYLYWFRGFVSGYNFGNPSNQVPVGAMPDRDTLALYIDKFCRENPLLPFVQAARQLVQDTRERQNSSKGSPSRK